MGILQLAVAVLSLSYLTWGVTTQSIVNQTNCDNKKYVYRALAGYGFLPADFRDKFGDTLGGIGSSIALDRKAWKKTKSGSYEGVIWTLPDRGWYVQAPRISGVFGIIR
jgi:hypothetical protein